MLRHTITIIDPAKLREAAAFAEKNGCEAAYAGGIARLLTLIGSFTANAESFACELSAGIMPDSGRPHSFSWWADRKHPDELPVMGKTMMNGGLIHHGPADDGSGAAPAFSAVLGRDAAKTPHEWLIHT